MSLKNVSPIILLAFSLAVFFVEINATIAQSPASLVQYAISATIPIFSALSLSKSLR
jgi:hypothetical protein